MCIGNRRTDGTMRTNNLNGKSIESWIWDFACSICDAKDAPKSIHPIMVMAKSTMPVTALPILCDPGKIADDKIGRFGHCAVGKVLNMLFKKFSQDKPHNCKSLWIS